MEKGLQGAEGPYARVKKQCHEKLWDTVTHTHTLIQSPSFGSTIDVHQILWGILSADESSAFHVQN